MKLADREGARKIADLAGSSKPQDLLRTLYERINNPSQSGDFKNHMLLGDFAALLVAISKEAAETAEKNLKIQNRLIILTILILAFTVAPLLPPLVHYFGKIMDQNANTAKTEKLSSGIDK